MSIGAGAVLVFQNGLIGLQLKDNLNFLSDCWKLTSFGGGIESGETIDECLARELEEELGLQLKNYRYEYFKPYRAVRRSGEEAVSHMFIVYDIDISLLDPKEGSLVVLDRNANLQHLQLGEFACQFLPEIIHYLTESNVI
ncbi:MAG: hypothetical protein OHK0017_05290 [Patescibacteria group bacterium]